MNQLNSFQDTSSAKNNNKEVKQKNNQSNNKIEKVLCNHCGRTNSNGIRCIGICLADSEY